MTSLGIVSDERPLVVDPCATPLVNKDPPSHRYSGGHTS